MAQTVAELSDIMKQVYTADRLVEQIYQDNPLLERIEKTDRFNIGREAVVPVHAGRSGGYSVMPAAGGTLNADDKQNVDTAAYGFSHQWFQVGLQAAAIAQTEGGSSKSVANAVTLEVDGAINDLRKQITRQVIGNGDALIAQCTTTSNTTPVNLLSTGYGYDAIVRGWLYPGLQVDVGTAANEVLRADAHFITAVSEDATTPTITLSTTNGGSAANLTTASTDFVSIANARSGATSYETNGIRQIAGSTTSALGGLDPDTAGEEFWKPSFVETTATTFSLDKALELGRRVHQKTGKNPTFVLTSLKQQEAFYKLLQSQVRFASDKGLGAGNDEGVRWAGMEVHAQPDVPDREWYALTIEDLFVVAKDKPRWASDIQGGANKGLVWNTGTTKFSDACYYPFNLAAQRRNSHAAWTSITA